MNRNSMLEAVRDRVEPWDLIVVGGGATGAGCALDAASRGLDVLLLERGDFGEGTSSRSTKLIHGGVRYLEQGNLSLVREALAERGRLRNNAPQHVKTQPFIVPCYSYFEIAYYGAGLKFYDLLSGKQSFGKSRILSKKTTIERLPEVETEGLRGGIEYFDGKFDDTRLLLELIVNAVQHGATVLNYARVDYLSKTDDKKINGVEFECVEKGERFTPKARAVINATGSLVDSLRIRSDSDAERLISASRGVHLVFECSVLNSETALMIPKTDDGRVLFAIPFYEHVLVGTTDVPVDDPTRETSASEEEIDFILETMAGYFKTAPARNDIKSVFAGIRPLVKDGSARNTSTLSRGHTIVVDISGLVTVTGGKWTTYRNMAEDAVSRAVEIAGFSTGPSKTKELKLSHSFDFETIGLEQKISKEFDWTYADVVRSVRFEMARTVEDVLARRTRLLFLDAVAAVDAAPITAELIAAELGYGVDWIENQIEEFERVALNYSPKGSFR
ncbi:MAG: glycerol-3-phosphate dehydrogenase/oxidase [Pyrinomonadaceae bacterium]|nr:glycerol-3-phosphate dehydrogenase/oxidase [Pyrinomonadaceae bacterium]